MILMLNCYQGNDGQILQYFEYINKECKQYEIGIHIILTNVILVVTSLFLYKK